MDKKRIKKKAQVDKDFCVACGACGKVCPLNCITIKNGIHAEVDTLKCVGCGKCAKECPASVIDIIKEEI